MSFGDIIGHKEIIKTLRSSLTEAKIGHAYLFLGPVGIGKKSIARQFAANLLCPVLQVHDERECPSCRQFSRGSHPDFITVVPSGNTIKIEQLRELQHQAYLRPLLGERKIFFFPDAEQLTDAAANSFLKILEEPPAGVIFLFAAIRADRVLPTIRSRCQVYQLFPVPVPEIKAWLSAKGYSETEVTRRATNSHGLPGLAIAEMKETRAENSTDFSKVLQFDLLQFLKFANEVEKKERREVLAMLREWEAQLRINMMETASGTCKGNLTEIVFLSEKLTQVMNMVESNVSIRLALEEFFLTVKMRLSWG